MATNVAVSGHGPLSFTDENGAQRFVPLSAFEFVGSDIQLKSAWGQQFDSGDQQILLALAAERVLGGELVPPPLAAPAPAVAFTAAVPGKESSGITVGVKPDAGAHTVFDAKVAFSAKETDVYANLPDAAAAAMAIGVDTPSGNPGDPVAGTGLVMVKTSVALGDGLPKDGQNINVKAAGTKVLAADNSSTLFTLAPRSGAPAGGIPVNIAVDSVAGTFTVTASYDSGAQSSIDLTDLGSLPDAVKFVVTASAPPSGLALPAERDVPLTGGAPGIAATGVAYTS